MNNKLISFCPKPIGLQEIIDCLDPSHSKVLRLIIEKLNHIITDEDPSHDITHSMRVVNAAMYIGYHEGGDMLVIIAASLLHDIVNIPKNSPNCSSAADQSADLAEKILLEIPQFPKEKIAGVKEAIREHSFSKNIRPTTIESKIVQDADRLDSTGAISIFRTFASVGVMKKKLYHLDDPFCKDRNPDSFAYGLDLFFNRLLLVHQTMNTPCAMKLGKERHEFLLSFLEQLKRELFVPK